MIRKTPRPILPGLRPLAAQFVAVLPEAPQVQDQEPREALADASEDPTAWGIVDGAGVFYIENPMRPGHYARYQSVDAYNGRKVLPDLVTRVPTGRPIPINLTTLKATP